MDIAEAGLFDDERWHIDRGCNGGCVECRGRSTCSHYKVGVDFGVKGINHRTRFGLSQSQQNPCYELRPKIKVDLEKSDICTDGLCLRPFCA